MKVTQEMVDAFQGVQNCECHPEDEIGTRLQAVLDLIDPVPDEVSEIIDGQGDEWFRNPESPQVWILRDGPGYYRSIDDVVRQYGPITWEGKA